MNQQLKFRTNPAHLKSEEIADSYARANAHHCSGNLAEAQAGYKEILKKYPNHFDTLYMLAVSEQQRGDSQSAVRLLRRSLQVDPRSAQAWYALAAILSALQRTDEALACYEDLIALQPDFVDAHMERGLLLSGLGRFAEAIASYDKAIAIDPHHADALRHKGEALHYLGRFTDAITCYNQILITQPSHLEALIDRGCAFKDLGRADEALDDFDRVISINPSLALAWLGRTDALMLLRKTGEALEACQRAIAIDPNSTKALTQIGQCHASLGNAEAAVSFFDRALSIDPDYEVALQNRIFTLDFCAADDALQQSARAEWWSRIGARISAQHPPHHENAPDPARRIVLGYVSGDFRHHSAAYAFRPVLENHDKSQFEVICYSTSPKQDGVTDSFRQIADRWRDVVQWSDEQLADCIRSDKVDILVDLSGYTRGHRLLVFARKPAPIQVTAWGHASGNGCPTIDYLFADPVMLSPETRHLFAEQIYDLPCTFIIESPPLDGRASEPPVTSNGYVTYGVFTRASRLSDSALATWGRILRSDVTSRLIIKDHQLKDASIQARLIENLAAHGVTPDRISLIGSTSREEHLAAYRHVDICLDPFPHGGGVSTWEALHMGVPVVTKMGNARSSRVGGAILSAIDMTDWIAGNDDQYVDIALQSAPDRLRTIRNNLPDLIGARCSPASYTRAAEKAYRTMWEKYCAGRPG